MMAPPKRRSVLTVFDWSVDVIKDWIEIHQQLPDHGLDLFTSERGTLVSESGYCTELDLSPGLDFHSLRRSYVTHLIESGMDALFVQQQVGHEHASTTALYTCVTSDYRVRTLRRALDGTPHLQERGIDLSSSQVYRLVTGTPERVSLQFMAACTDIFDCSMDDLVTSTATAAKRRAANDANVVDLNRTARPRRARILPDAD